MYQAAAAKNSVISVMFILSFNRENFKLQHILNRYLIIIMMIIIADKHLNSIYFKIFSPVLNFRKIDDVTDVSLSSGSRVLRHLKALI